MTRTTISSIWSCAPGGCDASPTQVWNQSVDLFAGAEAGALALDAENIYWTSDQRLYAPNVMQCSKTDCEGTVVTLASSRAQPMGIASDGTNVYWAEPDGLMKCAVGGCDDSPTTLVASGGGAAVALDATHVYFAQAGATSTNGRIVVVAK